MSATRLPKILNARHLLGIEALAPSEITALLDLANNYANEAVRKRANAVISFGAVTWPHMLVRALLAEQLFRAHTILTGHPYHRA